MTTWVTRQWYAGSYFFTNPNCADARLGLEMSLLDQVREAIQEHNLFARGAKIVVGVSGGADSLALLHCLRALRDEFDLHLHAAHLNHQLRASESEADAEFVTALTREWKLSATIETRDVGRLAGEQRISLEEAARRARYTFFAEVAQFIGASVVAVAHNRDDQVETLLMHLFRGAGLAGLRGMQHKTEMRGESFGLGNAPALPLLYLVRPLLDAPRAEIERYCKEHYLAPRVDRSNFDTVFYRNRLRHEILPFLERLSPNLREVLYRSSIAIADDYDFLMPFIHAEYQRVVRHEIGRDAIVFARDAWRALHPAVQRGTLRLAAQKLRGELRNLGWVHIEEARRIALEKTAGASATLPQGLTLIVGYDDFVIADSAQSVPLPDLPLLHAKSLELPTDGIVALPDSDWVVETQVTQVKPDASDRWTAVLDFGMCRGERHLRRRKPGDRFQPAGMAGHSRSLHDFMIDEKIQRAARALLPVLTIGDRIVWVCGLRVDERARVTALTREFWRVTFRKK